MNILINIKNNKNILFYIGLIIIAIVLVKIVFILQNKNEYLENIQLQTTSEYPYICKPCTAINPPNKITYRTECIEAGVNKESEPATQQEYRLFPTKSCGLGT